MAGITRRSSWSNTPKPSNSGICTSRKTRSGLYLPMAATASRPSAHSPRISMSGSLCSNWRIRSRASGSSSTISVRIFALNGLLALRPLVYGQPVVADVADELRAFFAVRRFDDVAVYAQLEGLHHLDFLARGSQHHHRNDFGSFIGFQLAQHVQPADLAQ